MKPCDLDTGGARIGRALQDLLGAWEEVSDEWNDSVSEAVFKDHIEPMAPVVKTTLDAVGRMRTLLHQAQRDLEG
ncbi:MAG: hypothetical protein AAGA48_17010 [Myxococcota bacterium]